MDLDKAIKVLDDIIQEPPNKMVDLAHLYDVRDAGREPVPGREEAKR